MVTMPHWPIPRYDKNINLGLDRIKELLNKLGNPHLKIPPVIHVAGTNGKGSTIAFLTSILQSAGYKIHRYTSPHLVRFNERIIISDTEITDNELYAIIEEVRYAAKDMDLTFFEGTTAAAFLAFSKKSADISLIEVGLGGRLDATNVIKNPILSIITPVSMDHMDYLGNNLSSIASEKAGIIKQKTPCVISWQYKESQEILLKICKKMNAETFVFGEHWNIEKTNQKDNSFLIFQNENKNIKLPKPSLRGVYQILNAGTAIAASVVLQRSYDITNHDLARGISSAIWPARFEKINKGLLFDILPSNISFFMDGAHNIAGAEMLAASIKEISSKNDLIYIINGRTEKRDIESFLQYFKGLAEMIIAIPIESEPLSEKAKNIHQTAQNMGFRADIANNIKDAVMKCILDARSRAAIIIACGSLYIAGDIAKANSNTL
ncbi:MAG: bifunctional folylpolyglutamate synthase/dihydrofolate synthase [Proteobacteria bacterium]|nr:bifunctional folylpolyglutamate synthase/dihydrofolate synthase [Pseudomonadota bacterium]